MSLNGRSTEAIEAGLQQVRSPPTDQYSFTTGRLKGVIEQDSRDRICIGVGG